MRWLWTREQWKRWTLPSKLTAIGAVLGALGIIAAVVFFAIPYFFPPTTKTQLLPPTEEAVLCPHALNAWEEALLMPAPRSHSPYAKTIVVESAEKIFRARIYTRTMLDDATLLEAVRERGEAAVGSAQGVSSVEVQANAGATRFKIGLFASEDIKLICVDRIN